MAKESILANPIFLVKENERQYWFDPDNKLIFSNKNELEVKLAPTSSLILETFTTRKQFVTIEQLVRVNRGTDITSLADDVIAMRVAISDLRKKLQKVSPKLKESLITRNGQGYFWEFKD